MAQDIKTATVLAFERKLDVSDALFFAGQWDERGNDKWQAVKVNEKSVRGTISNRLSAKDQDSMILDSKIESPNLQTVDVAALPLSCDTLKVQFTLRVLGGAGSPSACNNSAYRKKLVGVVNGYIENVGFSELSGRYACNLANGRFLWRNRIGVEQIEVVVEKLKANTPEQSWKFNALDFSLRDFNVPDSSRADINALSECIAAGLHGKEATLLRVTAFVRIGQGQEVFPSQELILDSNDRKSKTLYSVDGIASMHSQKVGNALRSIDTWYPESAENGPIAIEPYGAVTTQGKAYRQPKEKTDFYSLLDQWVLKDKVPSIDEQHFVIAVLVRGGVFGAKE